MFVYVFWNYKATFNTLGFAQQEWKMLGRGNFLTPRMCPKGREATQGREAQRPRQTHLVTPWMLGPWALQEERLARWARLQAHSWKARGLDTQPQSYMGSSFFSVAWSRSPSVCGWWQKALWSQCFALTEWLHLFIFCLVPAGPEDCSGSGLLCCSLLM